MTETGDQKSKTRKTILVVTVFWFGAFGFWSTGAQAAQYALLVGVSSYPGLSAARQLFGPKNDIALMRRVLLARGFEKQNIETLTDEGVNLPNRANILAGLDRLGAKSAPGDFIYLHFSGHGSQQPVTDDQGEADSLDEIFLPRDVGKWDGQIGTVRNAITDNELQTAITVMRRKGAFVWAVFDSCSSGTMLRGAGQTRYRRVDPGELAIPRKVRVRRMPIKSRTPPATGLKGGFIGFYAAQTNEVTPELDQPSKGSDRKPYGLFSFSLAEALSANRGMTYRQLGQAVLQNYAGKRVRMPTPLFEGSDLDAPVFGTKAGDVVRQWRLERRGAGRRRKLLIRAGSLHNIGTGAVFAILDQPAAKDEDAIAYARAADVGLFDTQLEMAAYGGRPAADPGRLPRLTTARLIKPAVDFELTVSLPVDRAATTAREKRLLEVLKDMRHKPVAVGKGVRVKWVKAGEEADLRLAFSPGRGRKVSKSCPRNRLWFLNRLGALICDGARQTISFEIGEPSPQFAGNVKRALASHLGAIGKVTNLERMVGRYRQGRFAGDISVELKIKRRSDSAFREADLSKALNLNPGDQLELHVRNRSTSPVDLTVLFVDSRYGITPLFPFGGNTNRVEAGGVVVEPGTITADTLGQEGMLVIAVKGGANREVADFRFLAQETLAQKKLLRGTKVKRQTNFIEDLFRDAGFGTRSAGKKSPRRRSFGQVAVKSLRWLVE